MVFGIHYIFYNKEKRKKKKEFKNNILYYLIKLFQLQTLSSLTPEFRVSTTPLRLQTQLFINR